MWVFLYFFLEHRHFLDQIVEIFIEDVMQFVGLAVEFLGKGGSTMTESRWALALPDCSPTVLPNSLIPVDIFISCTNNISPNHKLDTVIIRLLIINAEQ